MSSPQWIQSHPADAQKLVVDELTAETRGKIAPALIAHAWDRIALTGDVRLIHSTSLSPMPRAAPAFLRQVPSLAQLIVKP